LNGKTIHQQLISHGFGSNEPDKLLFRRFFDEVSRPTISVLATALAQTFSHKLARQGNPVISLLFKALILFSDFQGVIKFSGGKYEETCLLLYVASVGDLCPASDRGTN
jgi:hypothetical protein